MNSTQRKFKSPLRKTLFPQKRKEKAMSYKTIIVHVDESKHASARALLAASIAVREQAHLIGAVLIGILLFVHDTVALSADNPDIASYLDTLRERADAVLKKFEDIAQQMGVASVESRRVDDEAGYGMALQARYADLVVLGQHDPDDATANTTADFPEYVVMNCTRPVLIVPRAGGLAGGGGGGRGAGGGGGEAAAAGGRARPLLKQADAVEVGGGGAPGGPAGGAGGAGAGRARDL